MLSPGARIDDRYEIVDALGAGGMGAGKVSKVDAISIKQGTQAKGETGGTEDINIGVGELQELDLLGANYAPDAKPEMPKKPMTWDNVKNKAWSGRAPLPRGSLTLMVPAGKCRVGARYPSAEFGTGTMIFEMENIMVSSCSSGGGGGSLPMEEISFNYEKIRTTYQAQDKTAPKTKVRGWDPQKKEQ